MINWFYLNFHPLYKELYYVYKKFSDREIIFWTKNYLKEGMVAVDVGANIGFYSDLFSGIVGNTGRVHAFEPDETNFKFLKKGLLNRSNISLHNLAVGDKNKSMKLYLSKNLNVDHRTYKTDGSRITAQIKSVTLDAFFKADEKIQLLKIDIQGFDFFAIKGARNFIKRQKQIAIIGEFWPYGLKQAGVNPQDYLDLLRQMRLKVRLTTNKSWRTLIYNKNYYTNFIAYK